MSVPECARSFDADRARLDAARDAQGDELAAALTRQLEADEITVDRGLFHLATREDEDAVRRSRVPCSRATYDVVVARATCHVHHKIL